MEYLEDRITPSVTVTTTLDPTTPIAEQLSLREAINMVNASQVADNIILPTGTYQDTHTHITGVLQNTGVHHDNRRKSLFFNKSLGREARTYAVLQNSRYNDSDGSTDEPIEKSFSGRPQLFVCLGYLGYLSR